MGVKGRVRPARTNRARQWRVPLCEVCRAAFAHDADGVGVRRCECGLLHRVLVDCADETIEIGAVRKLLEWLHRSEGGE